MQNKQRHIIFRQSRNVILRPVIEEDIEHFLVWINDIEVTKYLTCNTPTTKADEEKWFQSLSSRAPNDYVLAIVAEGKVIGTIGLHKINYTDRTATTGAFIGEKDCWNKGYGTEAKMLILEFAFNHLNLRKICSEVIAFNGRSVRYSKKCGYVEDGGPKKAHIFRNNQYHDLIQLAVFKEDWLPLWEKFAKEHGINL